MTEQFVKDTKSTDEKEEAIRYLANEQLNIKDVEDIYGRWAGQYNEDVLSTGYAAPIILATEVDQWYHNQKSCRILDVGAGTGLAGEQLYEKGYHNIDALDGSILMLAEAKQSGCYQKFYEEYMGKQKLNIPDESYDVIISCGAFIPGHLDEKCYDEMLRLTKKGGHIFIMMKELYFRDTPEYASKLEPRMLEMERQGLWKVVMRKSNIENYHGENSGLLIVLQRS